MQAALQDDHEAYTRLLGASVSATARSRAVVDSVSDEQSQSNWTDEWKALLVRTDLESVPLRQLVRRGIPDTLRGPAWRRLSRADEPWPGEPSRDFRALCRAVSDASVRSAIEKDIRRTFPRHVLFETQQGQDQLYCVLCAYAAMDPHVGYCQGMGFIAAFLLCYASPETTFFILRAVMCRPEYDLRSMLSPGMPKFNPAMKELLRFIEIALPEVAAKFQELGVDPSVFASQWFITLFSYSMPFALVARIWDLFFLKKWSVAFRVAVALLQLVEAELLKADDMEEVLRVLKTIPERLSSVEETNAIIERAMRLNLDEDDARVLGNVASVAFGDDDVLLVDD